MFFKELTPLVSILDKSPFFTELSIKEREALIKDLIKTYPQLFQEFNEDIDLGYESSWLIEQE